MYDHEILFCLVKDMWDLEKKINGNFSTPKMYTCSFLLIKALFYHVYCKDQRNATVIILRYTTRRHNGL